MCGEPRPAGTFDLYAVEGGTAAMCYLFKSLKANRLLNPGDTIAMVTPIFTPYLEMPHLEDYDLKIVFIPARQEQRWQFTDEDLAPLLDPDGQGLLRRQSRQPVRRRAQPRVDRRDRPRPREAPGPHAAHRRRLWDVRPGIPLAARRVSQEHDRRLLLQQVLRLFGLAPGRHRPAREQRLRREDRRACPKRSRRRSTSATRR